MYILIHWHPPSALDQHLTQVLELQAMEVPARATTLLAIALLILPNTLILGREVGRVDEMHHPMISRAAQDTNVVDELEKNRWKHGKSDTLQIAGSKLPDCSHACGTCSPCHLVMVSFICASIQEAETCPIAYKCMCNNKAYPVP